MLLPTKSVGLNIVENAAASTTCTYKHHQSETKAVTHSYYPLYNFQ